MLKKFLKHDMPMGEFPSYTQAFPGQMNEAVGFVLHISHLLQRLERAGYGGTGDSDSICHLAGAHRAVSQLMQKNDLQIIFKYGGKFLFRHGHTSRLK